MKFATFILAIIVALVTMNFMPYVEAHTVTFINHISKGALTREYAFPDGEEESVDGEVCISHCLMHLHIDEAYKNYHVEIEAGESKTREFTNDRDYCLRLHGGTFGFEISDC
ncbi:hypothetical protein F8M41_026560 [Gigaspora margarita]|uniref:Uncharacterized protein n=1 Tax=Gigaspora margarita TaxID=4874 RepID=A0A8H4A8X1_GIGMA|nr:hypothetical protein F8M41_026560 [Gigaspora margarita]